LTIDIAENGGITLPDPNTYNNASSDNCSSLTFTYEYEPVVSCGTATYDVDIRGTDEAGNFTIGTTTLTVRDIRAADIPLTAIATPVSCFGGSDGMIVLDDNGITYTEVNANGAALDQLAAGEYTVTAIDEDGCTATTTITIDEPAIIALNVNGVTDEQTEEVMTGVSLQVLLEECHHTRSNGTLMEC